MNKLIALYMKELTKRKVLMVEKGTDLEHISWMLAEMILIDDQLKRNRWLGFIQGILYKEKIFTIEELRKQTKKYLS